MGNEWVSNPIEEFNSIHERQGHVTFRVRDLLKLAAGDAFHNPQASRYFHDMHDKKTGEPLRKDGIALSINIHMTNRGVMDPLGLNGVQWIMSAQILPFKPPPTHMP